MATVHGGDAVGRLRLLVESSRVYEVRGVFPRTPTDALHGWKVEASCAGLSLGLRVCAPHGNVIAEETLHFPPDVEWEGGMKTQWTDAIAGFASLSIKIARSIELGELIKQLSLDEARGLLATLQQRGGASLPSLPLEEAFNFADTPDAVGGRSTLPEPVQHLLPPSWHSFGQPHGLGVTHFANETHRSLAPTPFTASTAASTTSDAVQSRRRDALITNGYTHTGGGGGRLVELSRKLEGGITELQSSFGLPPLFVLAFDEAWEAVELVRAELAPSLGGGAHLTHGIRVDVQKVGGCGWPARRLVSDSILSPSSSIEHVGARDAGFREDGMPLVMGVWLSLTGSAVDSSCIYALPARGDATYRGGGGRPETGRCDLNALVVESLHHVCALPIGRGDALAYSQRLVHWGSAHTGGGGGTEGSQSTTFALGFTISTSPNAPLLRWPCAIPPLEARLALIALWLLIDHHHHHHHTPSNRREGMGGEPAALGASQLGMALGLLQGYADHLSNAALEWSVPAGGHAKGVPAGGHAKGVGSDLQRALFTAWGGAAHGEDDQRDLVRHLIESLCDYMARQRGVALSSELQRLMDARTARLRSISPQPTALRAQPLALDALVSALRANEPMLLRGGWDHARGLSFRREFEAHAAQDASTWQSLGAGKLRLHAVWASPGMRLEHALDSVPDGVRRDGPLDAMLRAAQQGSAAHDAARAVVMMRAAANKSGRPVQREPAFVTAPTAEAPVAGGAVAADADASLALTHFDEYTNLALLLIGTKRWLLLPPDALLWDDGPRSHSQNERLDVSVESHPHLPWREVVQGPGDVLVVPTGWWHRVASARQGSVLFNLWCD